MNIDIKIKNIQVFGPRGCGTNWMDSLVRSNIKNINVMKTHADAGCDNYGWKHGDIGSEKKTFVDGVKWRYEKDELGEYTYIFNPRGTVVRVIKEDPRYTGIDKDGDRFVKNHALPLSKEQSGNVLLIVMYRDPITFLRSVQRLPHQALELIDADFSTFIRSRWRGYAESHDAEHATLEERQKLINKCDLLEDEPSVFAHRVSSIRIMENFKNNILNVVYVPYEVASNDPREVLAKIARIYNLEMNDDFTNVDSYKGLGREEYKKREYETLKEEDLHYILDQIMWDYEKNIGYTLKEHPSKFSSNQLVDPTSLISINFGLRYYKNGEKNDLY